jgi:four helix bundle protein
VNEPIVRSFEDLEVYQRAYKLALELHKLTLEFPRIEQFALADQIRRASKSICANIAEGFARQHISTPDFHRYVVLALGSSDEMKVWIRFSLDLGYVPAETAKRLRDDYATVSRMLHGVRNKWK